MILYLFQKCILQWQLYVGLRDYFPTVMTII
uniref:Uncharacterized protein n=1 Tax=Anguilla anguilla TaxID=7936 RepID=A0A0E9TCJ9_ANGAN